MVPVDRGCIALMWPLAVHPTHRNEVLAWDLSADPLELLELDAHTIRQRLFTRTQDLPPGTSRLPIKTIHINRSPVVIGQLKTLDADLAQRWGLDLQAQCARAQAALAHSDAFDALPWHEVHERPRRDGRRSDARAEAGAGAGAGAGADTTGSADTATDGDANPHTDLHADVDTQLYAGMVGADDRRLLQQLIGQAGLGSAAPAALLPTFEDPRLEELCFRYRARRWPESLDEDERQRWQAHCRARLHEGKGGWMTLAQYARRIDELFETAADSKQIILEALVDWAEAVAPTD